MKRVLLFILATFAALSPKAQNTYVPDDNFEQALINLGYDSGPLDDSVMTSNINLVFTLNLDGENIADLTGIQDFTVLFNLSVRDNQLTALDVSGNGVLRNLDCSSNNINDLKLNSPFFFNNLNCSDNDLSTLDLSGVGRLAILNCSNNQLDFLEVGANTRLSILDCSDNQLVELDLSANNQLQQVNTADNALTVMDIQNGANTDITAFDARGNANLTCIQVDDTNYSTNNWNNIDQQTVFSTDCSNSNLSDGNLEQLAYSTYPNPTQDRLQVAVEEEGSYRLMNSSGATVGYGELDRGTNTVPMAELEPGIYVLHIISESGQSSSKVIKQ